MTVFVSHRKLQGAVARAVGSFNAGASHLTEVMELLAIEVNELNLAFVDECDRQRLVKAELANTSSAHKKRVGTRNISESRPTIRTRRAHPM